MRLVRRRAYISRLTVLLPTFSQEYNRQLLTRQKAQAGDLAKLRQKVLSRAMRKYLRGEDDVVRRSSDAQVDVRGKLKTRLFEILKYVMARYIYIYNKNCRFIKFEFQDLPRYLLSPANIYKTVFGTLIIPFYGAPICGKNSRNQR